MLITAVVMEEWDVCEGTVGESEGAAEGHAGGKGQGAGGTRQDAREKRKCVLQGASSTGGDPRGEGQALPDGMHRAAVREDVLPGGGAGGPRRGPQGRRLRMDRADVQRRGARCGGLQDDRAVLRGRGKDAVQGGVPGTARPQEDEGLVPLRRQRRDDTRRGSTAWTGRSSGSGSWISRGGGAEGW